MICQFEQNGLCYALACYTKEKCAARDENDQPKYSSSRKKKELASQKQYSKKYWLE